MDNGDGKPSAQVSQMERRQLMMDSSHTSNSAEKVDCVRKCKKIDSTNISLLTATSSTWGRPGTQHETIRDLLQLLTMCTTHTRDNTRPATTLGTVYHSHKRQYETCYNSLHNSLSFWVSRVLGGEREVEGKSAYRVPHCGGKKISVKKKTGRPKGGSEHFRHTSAAIDSVLHESFWMQFSEQRRGSATCRLPSPNLWKVR